MAIITCSRSQRSSVNGASVPKDQEMTFEVGSFGVSEMPRPFGLVKVKKGAKREALSFILRWIAPNALYFEGWTWRELITAAIMSRGRVDFDALPPGVLRSEL